MSSTTGNKGRAPDVRGQARAAFSMDDLTPRERFVFESVRARYGENGKVLGHVIDALNARHAPAPQ